MAFVSPRAYGGVGYMIDKPAARVEVELAERTSLVGNASLDESAQREVEHLVLSLAAATNLAAAVTIHEHALQHVGFGSKTALKLSIVAAFDSLAGIDRGRAAQQVISGRGGASGVGVHGFYEGGVLWDAGRPREQVHTLLPSSGGPAAEPPLLMLREQIPPGWRVGLCLPAAPSIQGVDERRFFVENTPIDPEAALRAMALLYHGVLPAFRSADLPALAVALTGISQTGFKRLEIDRCGAAVKELLGEFHGKGYAAGMSSMGPVIYVISDGEAATADLAHICASHGAEWLGIHRPLNKGAAIERRVDP